MPTPKPSTALEVRDNAIQLTPALLRDMKPAAVRVDIHDRHLGRVNSGGLVLRVMPSGVMTWTAIAYVDGRPKPHKLGRYSPTFGLEAARKAANALLDDPDKALARSRTGTFGKVANEFLEEYVAGKQLVSAEEYARCLRYYVLPKWQYRRFLEIRRRDVHKLITEVKAKHGQRQAGYVLAVIRRLCSWFETTDDSFSSPIARGMEPGNSAERERVLSDDELVALWRAADKAGIFGRFVKFALLCAQRREKIAGMTWPQLVDGTWNMPKAPREKGVAGLLPLPKLALDIIGRQPKLGRTEFVFAGRTDGPMNGFSKSKLALDTLMLDELDKIARERSDKTMAAKYAEIRALLKQARSRDQAKAKAAQLALRQRWWVLHDLRRTARSYMSACRVPSDVAELTLGHTLPGMRKIYDRYHYRQEKGEALTAVAKHIAKIAGLSRAKSARNKKRKPRAI
ncbi:MAG TPA: integrase family protein [Vineibacter sp.]|nr:integrase family protein [Vineibacter sp.]